MKRKGLVKKGRIWAIVFLIFLLTAGCSGKGGGQATLEKDLAPKVALIMKGPISDMSWNATAYNGLKEIEKLGAETAYQENVDLSAVGDSIRTYASEGYDVIFLATNSFEDAAMQVVGDFPDTQFIIINGSVIDDNVCSVQVSDEEQGFMMGVISALITKSNSVGFIGGLETAPIVNGSIGFEYGVKYVNENVKVNSTLTGSNSDTNKAKETATAMIEMGVDVLSPMADNASLGVLEATSGTDAMAICSGLNQEQNTPDTAVISVIKDTSVAYKAIYERYLGHDMPKEIIKMGADSGVIFLSEWYSAADGVDRGIKEEAKAIYEKLAKGEIVIPIN